jgi:hypothetical protein
MRWTGWTSCSRTRRSDAGVKRGGQEGDCFGVALFGCPPPGTQKPRSGAMPAWA